jgi:NADPH-dependent 7-cyano-7-deazaguanine reductase QueF-like protein
MTSDTIMNAVIRKRNYNTTELQKPQVSSLCCNIFEEYGTSYMNTEGISQIQAKKKSLPKKLSSSVRCARQVVQTAASQLPCLALSLRKFSSSG